MTHMYSHWNLYILNLLPWPLPQTH